MFFSFTSLHNFWLDLYPIKLKPPAELVLFKGLRLCRRPLVVNPARRAASAACTIRKQSQIPVGGLRKAKGSPVGPNVHTTPLGGGTKNQALDAKGVGGL